MSFGFGYKGTNFKINSEKINEEFKIINIETRNYTPEYHLSKFNLPKWLNDIVYNFESGIEIKNNAELL